jgi:predicted DNA-binding protein
MFKQTIKLDKELLARVRKCSEAAGYSTPDEFVRHVIERELAKIEEADATEDIVKKLKGLGYLE